MVNKLMDFSKIEKKWQSRWAKEKVFEAKEIARKRSKSKPKFYVLEQYPYPSGGGLHMGHTFVYTVGDIYARLKRMQGYNVLHPMGYDSFGLPAENAAIKSKTHPKKFTDVAIKNFEKQQKSLGLSYDWSRAFASHDPEIYKWDQWIFLKMLERGLAYRKKAPVNFCKKCNTVLANEQVVGGKCWRHENIEVEVKNLEQWFLKITDYSDELYAELDKLDGWPEEIKKLQRNWVGRSEGTEVDFSLEKDKSLKWSVFTTRADTLFGVTFLVVSAGHPELMSLVTKEQEKPVKEFLKKVRSTKEEDTAGLEKEGVFTGSYAINPINGEKVPIWVGNFVVADYGSGMVMGVPAHDERDFEFAKKYGLEIREVVKGNSDNGRAFTGYGVLVNSKGFDGLKSGEAIEHITNALVIENKGRKKIAYRLKDWLISRQRFWGAPIPVVYCGKCGIVPVPEKELPVKLPDNVKFTSVKNPLRKHKGFVNVKCPECGKAGKRETDTMDTFVNSSWYFLRFLDSKNSKKIFAMKKADYWMPIDVYIGGREHACMHNIYFRFYTKFLRDIGVLSKKVNEPALSLFNQGLIHAEDGRKMSKSYGNVVSPDEAIRKFGADAVRMFLVSVASPENDFNWSDKGVEGSLRFILKVMEFVEKFAKLSASQKLIKNNKLGFKKLTKLQESKLNRIVRNYTKDLENFKYNLAVIKLREFFSVLESGDGLDRKGLEVFLKMFSVICPHVAEELWSRLGNRKLIFLSEWPKADLKKIDDKLEETYKGVIKTAEDGKKISSMLRINNPKMYIYVVPSEVSLYKDNREKIKTISGSTILEIFAVNDKDKYDPKGKSKKAKPGRPGIYIE